MRTREEIKKNIRREETEGLYSVQANQALILEVLLDIREIINPPDSAYPFSDKESDKK